MFWTHLCALCTQGRLGHLSRALDLACDAVTRVVYVGSDGRLRTAATAGELWVFRGAGPNFGVILEVTLAAAPLAAVMARDAFYALGGGGDALRLLDSYSDAATRLPDSSSLDAFLFRAAAPGEWGALQLATSSFDALLSRDPRLPAAPPSALALSSSAQPPPLDAAPQRVGEAVAHVPTGLFDREMYMTDAFSRTRFGARGDPGKLLSFKRCVLLRPFHAGGGGVITRILRDAFAAGAAPNPWCYIHLLHCCGAVSRVRPSDTAFGVRGWEFAAVITGMWPASADGDDGVRAGVVEWVEGVSRDLLCFAAGAYPADLKPPPSDAAFAAAAFGPNSLRLAEEKQARTPSACSAQPVRCSRAPPPPRLRRPRVRPPRRGQGTGWAQASPKRSPR